MNALFQYWDKINTIFWKKEKIIIKIFRKGENKMHFKRFLYKD